MPVSKASSCFAQRPLRTHLLLLESSNVALMCAGRPVRVGSGRKQKACPS